MPPRYSVAFSPDPEFESAPRKRALSALARRALDAEDVASPAQISIVLTDDRAVRRLNRRYRATDSTTDVLSFAFGEGPAFATPPGTARQLGEVVISYPTALRQAQRAGHNVEDELAHLLVHGVLHVLGYDHETDSEEGKMRAREDAILGRPAH